LISWGATGWGHWN